MLYIRPQSYATFLHYAVYILCEYIMENVEMVTNNYIFTITCFLGLGAQHSTT